MSDWADLKHDGDLYSARDLEYARGPLSKTPSKSKLKDIDRSKARLKNRGMGDTGITTLPLTDIERQSVLLLKTKGLSDSEIALKLRRTEQSIAKILKDAEVATLEVGLDWRDVMEKKAIVAINAGLDCATDPYKRGTLGLGVGKGLGILESEGSVNFNALIAQIPESARSRYVSLPEPAPTIITIEDKKETS